MRLFLCGYVLDLVRVCVCGLVCIIVNVCSGNVFLHVGEVTL